MSTETNRFAAALTPGQILFSFQGRIPRKTYWMWGVGALLLIAIFFFILLGILGVKDQTTQYLVNALLLWPSLAITVKRWHDPDKSAWWLLILLVPVIGACGHWSIRASCAALSARTDLAKT